MLAYVSLLAVASADDASKVLALSIDYKDQIYLGYGRGVVFGKEEIAELLRTVRRSGFDEIYWCVSAVGKVTYPSKVMTVLDGTGLRSANYSPAGVILKQIDPLAVAIGAAHDLGMRVFVYITLFDFAYPGLESRFFRDHPEYWSRLAGVTADNVTEALPGTAEALEFSKSVGTGGDSKLLSLAEREGSAPYVRGVPSYGYPAVRNHVLEQVKELTNYRADGIYFDISRTHSGVYPVLAFGYYPQWTNPYLRYGYNEPEIARYRKLYGKNPPIRDVGQRMQPQSMDETEDEKKWNSVRGSFLTDFMREASRFVHEAGMKVAVGFYPESFNDFQPGTNVRQQMGRMEVAWGKWADEGLVDIIRLKVEGGAHGLDDWLQSSGRRYASVQRRGVRVYVDVSINGQFDKPIPPSSPLPITYQESPAKYLRVLESITKGIMNSSADGAFVYEAQDTPQPVFDAIRLGAGR